MSEPDQESPLQPDVHAGTDALQASPEPSRTVPAERSSAADRIQVIFLGPSGLRPGWRIFLYLGMAVILFFLLSPFEHLIPLRHAGRLWRDFYIEAVLAISAIAPSAIMAVVEKRPFGAYGLPPRSAFGQQFWIGLLWGIVSLSGLLLLMDAVGVFSFGNLALHGIRIARFSIFWGAYFLLVGFFEEFTVRGYMLFTLASGIRFWPAAIVLSLIFGGLHLFNSGEAWIGALAAAFIGLFFCLTIRRTGTLWFAVGMHTSWDWSESFLYSVPDSGGTSPGHLMNPSFHGSAWLTGGAVGPEGSLLVFVVLAILWLLFDRMYPPKTDRAQTSSPVA